MLLIVSVNSSQYSSFIVEERNKICFRHEMKDKSRIGVNSSVLSSDQVLRTANMSFYGTFIETETQICTHNQHVQVEDSLQLQAQAV